MMRKELLLEVGTFLARAWSEREVELQMKHNAEPTVKHDQNVMILPYIEDFAGDEFMQYRQWRVLCWILSMHLKYSTKYLQNDIAFGNILNTLEQKRVERLGILEWPGMINELIFNEAVSWQYRPVVNSLFGYHRRIVAFNQLFLTGYVKGDLDHFEETKVRKAVDYANEIIEEAINMGYGTEWVEEHVPKILKMLGIDPLLAIPLPFARTKIGIRLSDEELLAFISRLLKQYETEGTPSEILKGDAVRPEFEQLVIMSKITDKKEQVSISKFPVDIPEDKNMEILQRDRELINKLLRTLKNWKSGWVERFEAFGDEFDFEAYMTSRDKPFIKDLDLSVKSKIAILLDHSSSIASGELEYKRAFAALCKALDQLNVKFMALAFNTTKQGVKCWVIKAPEERWSRVSERRLWNVKASGGTPLGEVYENIIPIISAFKPDILLTLSDGEPNDPEFARNAIYDLKRLGVKMVSFGIGNDTARAIAIATNLKRLGYDKSISISNINELPKKVLALLANK
ncbi:MAG: hypothetical protein KatS3mg003_0590 [Candidatus Nitrosocaldaceae archaeon]|nr:MAG: hypothetical protein KatS3mg003_0590 [Candidatus Nitrosocaldaceae archaeon]